MGVVERLSRQLGEAGVDEAFGIAEVGGEENIEGRAVFNLAW